jgi:sulfur-carrier protein
MVNVQLPSQFSALIAGQKNLSIHASTLVEVFQKLDEIAPMIRSQIFDTTGSIRQFVGMFIDERQVNNLREEVHTLRNGCQILIVISVAGG